MTNPDCPNCHGLGWVCENHPDKVWSEEVEGGCQCGAGMPCECNRAPDDFEVTDIEGIIEEFEGETRH